MKSNFDYLPIDIKPLQEQSITIIEEHPDVEIKNVLDKNVRYNINQEDNMTDLHKDMNKNDLLYLKYASHTSADKERSFSIYKNLLADNRRTLKLKNIKKNTYNTV
jgi:hypothetical protein